MGAEHQKNGHVMYHRSFSKLVTKPQPDGQSALQPPPSHCQFLHFFKLWEKRQFQTGVYHICSGLVCIFIFYSITFEKAYLQRTLSLQAMSGIFFFFFFIKADEK